MKFLVVALLSTLSLSVFAISESNYKVEYQEKVLPVLNSYKYGSFSGQKAVNIHYATYASNDIATRCMVVLPGRSEPIQKYAEVVHSLDTGSLAGQLKYFLMDHRGQGSSARMISKDAGDRFKGYVDEFENYALDIKTFMDTVVAKTNCSEKVLLAHSLGAGISIDFLQRFPQYFERAVLTSPMLKIQTAPYKYSVARAIVLASMAAGQGAKFAPGQKPFSPVRNFENNAFTSSPSRYDMTMDTFDLFPTTQLGGVTNRWLNETMKRTKHLRGTYGEIRIPLQVYHAGIETYSEPAEMIRFCDESSDCKRTYLPTSKHEVLMDRDVNRDVVISGIEAFFK